MSLTHCYVGLATDQSLILLDEVRNLFVTCSEEDD